MVTNWQEDPKELQILYLCGTSTQMGVKLYTQVLAINQGNSSQLFLYVGIPQGAL